MNLLYLILFLGFVVFFSNKLFYKEKFCLERIRQNSKYNIKTNSKLRFNSTQELGEEYSYQLVKLDPLILNQCTKLNCYENNSKETLNEINDLITLKEQRDIVTIQEINMEDDPNNLNTVIAGLNMSQEEKEFIFRIYVEIVNPTTIGLKVYYNRVRPSFCNSSIEPILDVPNHPSYPSGHAVQHFFMAYYLYYRHNNKEYFEKAEIIAKNREIAGIHYKSDTEYGKVVAHDLIKIILKLIDDNVLYIKSTS